MSVQRKYSPDAEFQKVTVSSGSNRFNHFSKYDSESSDSESVYGVVCEEIIEPESEVGLSGERSFEEIYGSDSDDGQITARVGQPVTLTGQYEVGSTSQPQNITVGDTVQMNIGLGGGNGASNYKSDDTTTKQYHVGDNVNVTLNVNDVSDNESNSYSHTQKHDAEPPVIYVDQCSSRNSFTESDSSEPEREEQEFEIILKKSTKIEPSNKKHLKRLMKNSPQHDNSKQASVSLSVNVEQDTDMIPQGREEHQIANNTYMVTQRDERQIVGDTNMISQRQERQIIKDDDPVVFTSVTYQSSDDESIKSYTQFSDDNSSQHSTPNKTRKSTHSFTLSKNRTYSPEIVEFHNRSETPEIFEVQTQIESPEIFQETPSTDISFEQNNDEVDLIVASELPHHHERRGSMNFLPIDIEVQADPNDSRRCSVIIAPHSDDDDDDIQTKNHYSHFEVKHSEKKSEYSTRRESNTGSLSTATSYETVDYNVDLHDIYKKTKNLSFAKSNVLKQVRMKSMVLQKMRKHALLGTLKSGNRESTPENNRRRSVDSPSVTSHSYKERRQQSENKVSYSRDDKHIEYSRDTKRMEYDNDHHKDYDTGNRRRIDFDDRKSDHHDNRMHFNDDNRHKDLYSDMHNHSRESSIRNNEQQQIRRHSERESQFHSDKKEEIERNSYEAHSTNITEQHSSRETQLHQSSFNSERRDERRISEQTHQRHFGMHDKQRSKSVVNSPFRPNEMGGTFPRSSNRPGFLLSPQPTHPQQIGGIPTHPNQMGGMPSPPNQMGGMPSHPNQMGGMPSHPNQLGGMLSYPNQMGGMPSLPNQMGGMPSLPNQMGGMPSHPNQMGGMPSHPNQMGGMPSHPNQMGGMPSNPNQMGGMPSHPNQMGGMPSYPNQMGGMPSYPNQMGRMPSHPNQKYPSHSANNSPSHPKSGMHTPKPRSLSASSTPNMNRRRNSNTPKDSPLSKPPEKPKHKSSNPNAIIRRSDEDSGIKKPESEEDGSKDRSNSLPSFLAKGPWSQVLNVLGQKQKPESTAAQSSSKAKNAFLSARAKMAEQKKQQLLKEQHSENHMASAQLQSQTMSATQQQQQLLLQQQQQQQQQLLLQQQQQQQQQQQYQLQQNSMQSQSMSSSARSRKFSSFGSVVQKAHRATSSSMQHSSQRSKSVRHQSMRNSSHHHQQHHLQKHHSLKSRHEYQRSLHSSSYRNMTERQIRAHSNWKWAIDSVVQSIRESKHVTKHEEKRDEDSIRVEAKGRTIALVFNDEDKIIDRHHDTADQYYFDKNAEVHRNSKTRSKSVHEKSDHQRYLKRSPSFEDFQGKSKLELVREGSKHIPSEIVYYTVCTRYFHPENNDWIANIHRKGRVLVPRDVEHADKCVFWHELFEPDKEEMQVSKIIKQKRRKKHRRSRSAGPSPQMSRKKNDVPVMYGSHLKTEIKNDFHSSSSRLENNSFHRHESSMNHSMQTTMVY